MSDVRSEQASLTDAEREAVCRSSANHAKTVAAVERIVAERVAQAKAEAWNEGRESLALDFTRPLDETGQRPATPDPYSLRGAEVER